MTVVILLLSCGLGSETAMDALSPLCSSSSSSNGHVGEGEKVQMMANNCWVCNLVVVAMWELAAEANEF